MKPVLTFHEPHSYRLDNVPCDGVTDVLGRMIPGWMAEQWYLDRGTAVHACAALIAQGVAFDHDPQISGQVAACRLFWREWQPDAVAIEQRVASYRHRYAGTLDLLCHHRVSKRLYIIDYKASIGAATKYQLAAYAIAAEESGLAATGQIRWGLAVALTESGKYSTQEYDLRPLRAEWLVLLAADRIQRKEKVKQSAD